MLCSLPPRACDLRAGEKHAEVFLFLPVPRTALKWRPKRLGSGLLTKLSTPPTPLSPQLLSIRLHLLPLPSVRTPIIKETGLSEQLQPSRAAAKPRSSRSRECAEVWVQGNSRFLITECARRCDKRVTAS